MIDGSRNVMTIGARPAEERRRTRCDVSRSESRERTLDFQLALMVGKFERRAAYYGFLRHIAEQRIDIGRADRGKHRAPVVGSKRQIAHGT